MNKTIKALLATMLFCALSAFIGVAVTVFARFSKKARSGNYLLLKR